MSTLDFDFDIPYGDEAPVASVLASLLPCSRYVFERLAFTAAENPGQLDPRKPALILLSVDNSSWTSLASKTTELFIRTLGGTVDWNIRTLAHTLNANRLDQEVNKLLSTMSDKAVILSTDRPLESLPHLLLSLADAQFAIPPLDASAMTEMLRHRFAGWDGVWPADVDPSLLAPAVIDLALLRSPDAAKALSILTYLEPAQVSESVRSSTRRAAPFATLEGYGAAKVWGLQLAADIAAYRAGVLPWSEVDDGALLAGPPGTGKTLFAQSLAEHIGCAFTATSYADWQSSGSGHLGDLTKRIREIFTEAASTTPAIIFIDEIDTLPARSGKADHQDWWTAITNTLLELIDGAGRPDGIVVMAACNAPNRLDPALVRSGRLDRTFHIDLPDEAALTAIFASHLQAAISDADLKAVATALAGTVSGADVARIARDTRKRARHERRSVTAADLTAAAFPPDDRPAAVQWRVAVHEAGHAVTSMALGHVPQSISIITTGRSGGHVRLAHSVGAGTFDEVFRSLVPVLAGRAAESIILGDASVGAGGGPESDLGLATNRLAVLDAMAGLGTRLSLTDAADTSFVETTLRRVDAEARFLVWRYRPAIVELAKVVQTARVLGREALRQFAEQHGFETAATRESIDRISERVPA